MAGLEGRCNLLIRLGKALQDEKYFGQSQRPGCMIGKSFPYILCVLPAGPGC